VKAFALLQIRKASHACDHLTDPSEPEALHNFRVAVRRLRTWMRTFKRYHNTGKKTIKRLGRLTDSTNTSRDLEVCRDWLNVYISEMADIPSDNNNALKALLDQMTGDYEQELAKIQEHVPAEWQELYIKLKKHLDSDIDGDKKNELMPNVAGKKILKLCDTVDDQLGQIHGIEDRLAIHKLRIYFKRLRYLLEPFRSRQPALKEIIRFLKETQSVLGDFRDAHISIEMLATYHATLTDGLHGDSVDSDDREILIDYLLDRARKLELDRYENFRKLYVNGDFLRIIHDIRISAEELKEFRPA